MFPVGFDLGSGKSVISLVVGWLWTTWVLRMKIKRLWEFKDDFSVFCKIFVPRSEGPPLNNEVLGKHVS